jgi:hypothetical protein
VLFMRPLQDVAPTDPLRIEAKDSHKILQAEIVYTRTKANNFSVNLSAEHNFVSIKFDYFHTNEGIVIDLYHTGASGEEINLFGTIKGVHKIKSGTLEEGSFLDPLLDRTLGKIIDAEEKYPILSKILFWLVIIPLFPIMMAVLAIEAIFRLFDKPPKEFSLEDVE